MDLILANRHKDPRRCRRLVLATVILIIGIVTVQGQEVVEMSVRTIAMGTTDQVRPQSNASGIMMITSSDPNVATARRSGINMVKIIPQSVGVTTIEFWENTEQKLYRIPVSVVHSDENAGATFRPSDPQPNVEGREPYELKFDGGSKFVGFNSNGQLDKAYVWDADGSPMGFIITRWAANGKRTMVEINDWKRGNSVVFFRIIYDKDGNSIRAERRTGSGWKAIGKDDEPTIEKWKKIESYGN